MSFFSNLFNSESKSVIGLDIGSSSIKVVQLRRKSGHAVLETYGELALGPYVGKSPGETVVLSVQKIAEAVADLLREKEVKITTSYCGVAIPFSSSLVQVIELPVVSEKTLQSMVPIEARRYIPVPITEVVLDWFIIPNDKIKDSNQDLLTQSENPPVGEAKVVPKMELLLVAIHNDTIAQYKKIVDTCKLDANFFEIEIFSCMRSVLDEEVNPVLIVDIGASTTKLFIVEREILRASHLIDRGSQSITNELSKSLGISNTEAEVLKREKGLSGIVGGIGIENIVTIMLDYIFGEANRFILTYQKKHNKNISKVILVGGGSALKGIVDVAKKSFQTEVLQGNPFQKVVAPAFLDQVLKDIGPEFAVATGAALRKMQEMD